MTFVPGLLEEILDFMIKATTIFGRAARPVFPNIVLLGTWA
jgi:hypothetical protein